MLLNYKIKLGIATWSTTRQMQALKSNKNFKFKYVLHTHGSNNPNGLTSGGDRYAMYPYFIFKDLVTIFAFFLVLSIMVFFYPNAMGHADNWVPANAMVTPASIVPEW